VIEHLDPPRLGAFADAVFGVARPNTIVLTAPNAEYNTRYEGLEPEEFRRAVPMICLGPAAVPPAFPSDNCYSGRWSVRLRAR